ncbi:flagellar basal body rod protein FlgG [Metabacillus fastidiosus]|uniref:flagellar basal body rod protein FlgG n=1 Tax=Metabacillus fastidiosus TaxID=1458 RepID=UPI002DB9E91F|nr:flagellar basal body rod protein FlgG [Metabacillus fastidiosus]MEC2076973.1 flagellar basal body rod protein FlgG [Metabacillus fastidiosus]
MLRSMYAGISGMKGFQTKLDVIGNNIANVNTFGFKKGRVVFKDMINQQVAGATAPSTTRGGVNSRQVGLGSQLASIDTIHTIGATQTTNRTLDLAIAGDGFFVVGEPLPSTSQQFTRSGNFYLDKAGDIVNADGLYLLSALGDKIKISPTASSFSIGSNGEVIEVIGSAPPVVKGQIGLAKFENPEGLEKAGSNLFKQTTNSGTAFAFLTALPAPIPPVAGQAVLPGSAGSGTIVAGALEMSNVDLSEEFTEMIVAQRGFQSNTKIITTSDEILQELMGLKR